MNKKKQSQFDQNVKDGFDAIRSVVTTIAKKEAAKYEIEIYSRLKTLCEEQINVINEVEGWSVEISCREIKKVMEGGNK